MSYLTADHLGSARVITNQNGAVTTRKDYMAFGDEASSAQRTANPNYDSSETRKGYTGYEKDSESGLEFAQARYYNATHGRFTSVDPLTASASIKNPQTFNRYSYALNSPYKFTDPLGLLSVTTSACGQWCSNSGPWVDGSAFRGTDASIGQEMFEDLTINRNVEAASAILNSTSSVTGLTQTNPVRKALDNILKYGNSWARNTLSYLIRSGTNFTTHTGGASGATEISLENVAGLNAMIAATQATGKRISQSQALDFLTISISTSILNDQIDIEANLVHEASHALDWANVISSVSTGKSRKYIDVNYSDSEYKSKMRVGNYYKFKGGKYITHGQNSQRGEIDNKGNVNKKGIKTNTKNLGGTIQGVLKTKGVIW